MEGLNGWGYLECQRMHPSYEYRKLWMKVMAAHCILVIGHEEVCLVYMCEVIILLVSLQRRERRFFVIAFSYRQYFVGINLDFAGVKCSTLYFRNVFFSVIWCKELVESLSYYLNLTCRKFNRIFSNHRCFFCWYRSIKMQQNLYHH